MKLNLMVHIPGYEFIRRDRNRQGGGVGFSIKTSNYFVVCSNLNVPNLENLCIKIRKPNSKPFLIATWYRPPIALRLIYFYITNHFLKN